ncbi:MAG TPA: glycosyltransferase family 39 protein [Smithellaceae bacterium]|nr:glycosyltransferase family 39 protein [Smithellaceae bacterium]
MQQNGIFQKIVNSDDFPLLFVVLLKIILHLITINRYGYFIDELYNIAATRHLSYGILEMSSLGPLIYAGWIFLFGPSMASIRILALIPGVMTVWMSGLIARELGGKRPAQIMTALFVCLGPVWLAFNSFLGCDGFDQAATSVFLFLLIRILKTGNQKLWIAAGIAAGTAILFKQTLFFYLLALFFSLLLTKQRKVFLNGYLWSGVLCGFLILIPQFFRGFWDNWPLLEYWYLYAHYRTYHASLVEFAVMQGLLYSPLAAPVWIAGGCNFIFNKKMQQYRTLGLLYIFLMPVCFVLNVKAYVGAAIYPVLFAGGFILLEEYLAAGWKKKVRLAYTGLLIVTLLLGIPHGLPLFNIQNQAKYFQFFSFVNSRVKFDNFTKVTLPEHMADRIGWEERVKAVADVYNNLADDEKRKTSIYAAYYGFAGAIDLLGKKYNLPDALSGHASYHLWGYGNQRPENLITVQVPCESLASVCEDVRIGGYIPFIPYAMPYDNDKPICVCRKMKYSIEEIWPLTRHYD